jgi:hypothetical protein
LQVLITTEHETLLDSIESFGPPVATKAEADATVRRAAADLRAAGRSTGFTRDAFVTIYRGRGLVVDSRLPDAGNEGASWRVRLGGETSGAIAVAPDHQPDQLTAAQRREVVTGLRPYLDPMIDAARADLPFDDQKAAQSSGPSAEHEIRFRAAGETWVAEVNWARVPAERHPRSADMTSTVWWLTPTGGGSPLPGPRFQDWHLEDRAAAIEAFRLTIVPESA